MQQRVYVYTDRKHTRISPFPLQRFSPTIPRTSVSRGLRRRRCTDAGGSSPFQGRIRSPDSHEQPILPIFAGIPLRNSPIFWPLIASDFHSTFNEFVQNKWKIHAIRRNRQLVIAPENFFGTYYQIFYFFKLLLASNHWELEFGVE